MLANDLESKKTRVVFHVYIFDLCRKVCCKLCDVEILRHSNGHILTARKGLFNKKNHENDVHFMSLIK